LTILTGFRQTSPIVFLFVDFIFLPNGF